jgi:transposase
MAGDGERPRGVFSYVSPEARIPATHPLQPMRAMVDQVLNELSPAFSRLDAETGGPAIAPERLLRALLLQLLYSIRSERLLMEQLEYNLLFRWFVGLDMDDPAWDATAFTMSRQRLLDGKIVHTFFERVLARARRQGFLSDEHFTVDATLTEAWGMS